MKPAIFDYERPGNLDEAIKRLADPAVFFRATLPSSSAF
jgi:hypothetical protein